LYTSKGKGNVSPCIHRSLVAPSARGAGLICNSILCVYLLVPARAWLEREHHAAGGTAAGAAAAAAAFPQVIE